MKDQLDQAMQVFKRHFLPAEDTVNSDEQMTTQEIMDKFQSLLGEEIIDASTMALLLLDNGYKFDYILDEFLWLLKTSK